MGKDTTMTPCKYWDTQEGCPHGGACYFMHGDKPGNKRQRKKRNPPAKGEPRQRYCKFNNRPGGCTKRETCKHEHPEPKTGDKGPQKKQPKEQQPKKKPACAGCAQRKSHKIDQAHLASRVQNAIKEKPDSEKPHTSPQLGVLLTLVEANEGYRWRKACRGGSYDSVKGRIEEAFDLYHKNYAEHEQYLDALTLEKAKKRDAKALAAALADEEVVVDNMERQIEKRYCMDFNSSKGCKRINCRFVHGK